ncbi:MAG: phospholipase D-like domain-containing protein [Promethearchaeota archaeon]
MRKRVFVFALIAAICLSMYTFGFSQESYIDNQGFSPIQASSPKISSFPSTKFTGIKNVTAYTSPDSSYDLTIEYLRSAKFEIDIEIYSISNGFLVKELNDALARNHTMEMNVIISEGHASGAETHWSRATMYNLSQAKASIPAPNLNIFESNGTEFTFTHAKFIIIDREVVLVQSSNWAKTGIPPDSSYGNREWGVAIKDQSIVNYFLNVFANDMLIATPYVQNPAHEDTLSGYIPTGSYPDSPNPFSSQEFVGSMSIQPVLSPDNSNATIIQLLRSATSTIDVQQMYIKRYWDAGDDYFLEELIAAAGRGVTIRVILDGDSSGMDVVRTYLIGNGIETVFDNNTYFEWTHNKGVIVDGKIVLVSSINWSYESVNENREAGVIIYSRDIANYFTHVFEWDWSAAKQKIPTSLSLSVSSAVTPGSNISISAVLTTMDGGTPISSATIRFYIDDELLGTSQTGVSGTTTLTWNISDTFTGGSIWARYDESSTYGPSTSDIHHVTTDGTGIPTEWLIIGGVVGGAVVVVIAAVYSLFIKKK